MEYNYRKTRARHRTGYRNRRINRKKELIIKVSGTILTFVLVTGAVVSYFGKKQEDILVQAGDSMVKQVNEEMEITIPEGTTKEETLYSTFRCGKQSNYSWEKYRCENLSRFHDQSLIINCGSREYYRFITDFYHDGRYYRPSGEGRSFEGRF